MTIVSPTQPDDAGETAALVRQIIEPLAYYNERARREELAKDGADLLSVAVEDDPHAVLVAKDDGQIVGSSKLVTLENHWYGQDFFLWEWYPR